MLTAGEQAGLEQHKVGFQSEIRPDLLDKGEQVAGCSPPQPSGSAGEENADENPRNRLRSVNRRSETVPSPCEAPLVNTFLSDTDATGTFRSCS